MLQQCITPKLTTVFATICFILMSTVSVHAHDTASASVPEGNTGVTTHWLPYEKHRVVLVSSLQEFFKAR